MQSTTAPRRQVFLCCASCTAGWIQPANWLDGHVVAEIVADAPSPRLTEALSITVELFESARALRGGRLHLSAQQFPCIGREPSVCLDK